MSNRILKSEGPLQRILEYTPHKFELGVSETAVKFLETTKQAATEFRMSEAIRIQTGINKIEEVSFEEELERRTLERLKEVQETAYQEAYTLGLEEGKKEAFNSAMSDIDARLNELSDLLRSIREAKKELFAHNEAHIVKLAFHMAERMAHHQIEISPEIIVDVMKNAIEKAQIEEDVTVHVPVNALSFLESLQSDTGREFEFMKQIKLVGLEDASAGGCLIETNYGEIDARSEERVKKLWAEISESLPRVKNKVSAA
ncbi:MAG: hypothetical protein BroJett040_13820 [Oligoflexia bacterium]|nr:MAG: hypothetical protein BroJett040_13820 [Oligoflexia bacterium]